MMQGGKKWGSSRNNIPEQAGGDAIPWTTGVFGPRLQSQAPSTLLPLPINTQYILAFSSQHRSKLP